MGVASQEAWEILKRKEAYWQNALSDDAVSNNVISLVSIFDDLSFTADILLSDSLFSSLVSFINLGIPLSDIEPWNIAWNIELPSLDEFLRGVLLKITPVSLADIAPDLLDAIYDALKALEGIFVPDVAQIIAETRLEKGYYGRTRYGFAYYDPVAVRDFFKSTIYFMTKKPVEIETARNKVKEAGDALDIASELVSDMFNRLSLIGVVKEKTVTFDYSWFDYSSFSGSTEETVEFKSFDLVPEEVEYIDLFDATSGGWFDLSFFEYCFFTEEIEIYEHPWLPEDITLRLRDVIVANFRNRLLQTGMLVANYIPREEREEFKPSDRLEIFTETTSQTLHIDRIADQVLNQLLSTTSPVQRNLYKAAVKQIMSLRYGDSKKGLAMYKSMSVEEFKDWWIKYWSAQGLDPAILDSLWSKTLSLIDGLGTTKIRDKFKFIKSKLRMVK